MVESLSAQCGKAEIAILLEQDVELVLLEMMSFYMGLVGHIQIVSIYEGLKLLYTLINQHPVSIHKSV